MIARRFSSDERLYELATVLLRLLQGKAQCFGRDDLPPWVDTDAGADSCVQGYVNGTPLRRFPLFLVHLVDIVVLYWFEGHSGSMSRISATTPSAKRGSIA